jgi:hypothetical protein
MIASSTPTRPPSAPLPPAPGSQLHHAMTAIGTASVGFSRRRTPHHSSYRDYIGGGLASMPSAQPVPFRAPSSTANAFTSLSASSPPPDTSGLVTRPQGAPEVQSEIVRGAPWTSFTAPGAP